MRAGPIRLARMISTFLSLERLSENGADIKKERFSLHELIERCANRARVNPLRTPRPCMVGGLDDADLVPRPHRVLHRNGAPDVVIPVETIRLGRDVRSSGTPMPAEHIPWRVWPSRLPSVGGSCSGDPPAFCCA